MNKRICTNLECQFMHIRGTKRFAEPNVKHVVKDLNTKIKSRNTTREDTGKHSEKSKAEKPEPSDAVPTRTSFLGVAKPNSIPPSPAGEEVKLMSNLINQLLQMQVQLIQATQNLHQRQPQQIPLQPMNLQLQNPLYQMNIPQVVTQSHQV